MMDRWFHDRAMIGRLVLVGLCVQNASFTLMRKYVAMTQHVSSKEILIVGEIVKLVASVWFVMRSDEPSSSQGTGISKLWWLLLNSYRMSVLAAIYLAMNVLSFVSIEYIGAGEFTVVGQLKVLSTACFSVLVLGTRISSTRWRALAQLVIGCILVTSPALEAYGRTNGGTADISNSSPSVGGHEKEDSLSSQLVIQVGYGAVLLEVLLSGFASIYFEKVIKSSEEVITIWERNFQLSVYSIVIYACMIFYDRSIASEASSAPLFVGWDGTTLLVALLGAAGGLLVAGSLKYANSILKTMATAGAIVLSTSLGYVFLGGAMNYIVVLGAITTVLSIFNYTLDQTPAHMQVEKII